MIPLLSEIEIRQTVERLSREVNALYGAQPLTAIGVLTGSVVLLADLIRRLEMPLQVGVIQARSYRGAATKPGPLAAHLELLPEIRDRDVLLVDDIFDTGRTLAALVESIRDLGARSVRTLVLLKKNCPRAVALSPDFVGFDIPDRFVVGYGLDYRDAYRNLAHIAALEPDEIE